VGGFKETKGLASQAFCCFRTAFAQTSLAKLKGTITGFYRSKGLVQPHKPLTQTLNLPFGWEASRKQLPCFAGILLFQDTFAQTSLAKWS